MLLQLIWLTTHHPHQLGSFVELGANDGLYGSNSFALEACLGWRAGLLIEGQPKSYAALVRNRPNATLVNSAVCEQRHVF